MSSHHCLIFLVDLCYGTKGIGLWLNLGHLWSAIERATGQWETHLATLFVLEVGDANALAAL